MRPSLNTAAGFSLLEVLVAWGLVIAALTALAPLLVITIRADLSSRTRTLAVFAAGQKQEQLRSDLSNGLVSADTQGSDAVDSMGHALDAAAPDRRFTRRWQIQPDGAGAAGTTIVRVEVISRAVFGGAPIVVRLATVDYTVP